MIDSILTEIDKALKILTLTTNPIRIRPDLNIKESDNLSSEERKNNAKLMRVNHSGEVCAQGLYRGQLFFNKNTNIKKELEHAALEEIDHLSWCESRIKELHGKTSILNPILYCGSFGFGAITSIIDEKYNLGFLAETEKQVANHLNDHLNKITPEDLRTKAILEQMKEDEAKHEMTAKKMGAIELPKPIKKFMEVTSKLMTSTTFHI
jgi:ubiquinone biosynthesis monooxygenase Coq7